jgi:hypothetical protein
MSKTEALWTMPLKTIKYSQRLGDVLRCLPAAKYLAEQGHDVFFDCLPQYQGVFEMTSYVKAGHEQGDVLDLEVWPNRYEEYRKSRKTWTDFVYSHPEIRGADKANIILDKLDKKPAEGLPEKYNLIAPFGISQGHQRNPLALIQDAAKQFGRDNIIVLCPPEVKIEGLQTHTARSVEQMAKAVRDADQFWAINSAPVVLANATRRGKETRFWGQKNEWEADNCPDFDGLIRMD